jgi:histone H3/H4
MSELPLAAVDRIIRKATGARVSDSAAEELSAFLEEEGMKVAQQALILSKHANKKTIRGEDIRLACKKHNDSNPVADLKN